jgi:hypothetical protein
MQGRIHHAYAHYTSGIGRSRRYDVGEGHMRVIGLARQSVPHFGG